MRVRPVGAAALLIDCPREGDVERWRAELWRRRQAGDLRAAEIVPGARSVLVDGVAEPETTAELIAGWAPSPAAAPAPDRLVEVPVRYDGEDLGFVASLWGVSESAVVERLTGTDFRVAFCGFAPGFAYLAGLPEEWQVPRLDSPRARVPAGSVALAGRYAGVYPTASPGGWRLVGTTEVELFRVDRRPPALLPPGVRVRLVALP